jgi:hypothetical protein
MQKGRKPGLVQLEGESLAAFEALKAAFQVAQC